MLGEKYLLASIFVFKGKVSLTLKIIITPDNCLKPSQKKDTKLISHTENSQLEGGKRERKKGKERKRGRKKPPTQPGGINIKK